MDENAFDQTPTMERLGLERVGTKRTSRQKRPSSRAACFLVFSLFSDFRSLLTASRLTTSTLQDVTQGETTYAHQSHSFTLTAFYSSRLGQRLPTQSRGSRTLSFNRLYYSKPKHTRKAVRMYIRQPCYSSRRASRSIINLSLFSSRHPLSQHQA